MKDTVTEYQFIDTMAQKQHGFSYEGAKALFEYFEQYEQDTGERKWNSILLLSVALLMNMKIFKR
jgi:hypothetical protein